ncbi:MAG: 6-bladed beta-propeller, partial [Tannerellaceae bacterium]
MMKNQKKSLVGYWCMLILFGLLNVHCSNNTGKSSSESELSDENNTIVIDYKNAKEVGEPLKLSDICESISYTRLNDSLLIGDVKLVSVHFIQDTFYIDTDNIYTFTKDGKAIRALCTKGQGPEDI